jgi:hypothetical protein
MAANSKAWADCAAELPGSAIATPAAAPATRSSRRLIGAASTFCQTSRLL